MSNTVGSAVTGLLRHVLGSYGEFFGAEEAHLRSRAQHYMKFVGTSDGSNPPQQYLNEVGYSQKAYDIWKEECHKHNNR
jgi:hypothetical protein